MALICLIGFASCGGSGPFGLTAADNDPKALEKIFGSLESSTAGSLNRLGTPVAAVATDGEIALVDLSTATTKWKVAAKVESRLVIGRDAVVGMEGGRLVARDIESGSVSWRHNVDTLIGVAADATSFYVTSQSGKKWRLAALDGRSGGERWSASAAGALGAPAAARGIVLVPFLNQWLSILDAKNGKSLTRVRATEEQISFVRRAGSEVFFGSKKGVFLLDVRAANGSRAQSTYGSAKLPKVFTGLTYARDAYDQKLSAYTALDQRQLLWTAAADGPALKFGNGQLVAHYYRFLISLAAADGSVRWAYNHPKVDLIGAEDVGGVVVAVAKNGALVAVDSATGSVLSRGQVSDLANVRGASFDAAGFRPAGAGEPADTTKALTDIAFDRDSRFAAVKRLAISALAAEQSPKATAALIEVARGSGALGEKAAEALVARADPSGAPELTAELEKENGCVALCARALAAIENSKLEPSVAARAEAALLARFESPATNAADFAAVSQALRTHASSRGVASLRRFFLVHRADPDVAENRDAVAAITDALAKAGGAARAAVVFAAADPVTHASIAVEARRALAK